MIRKTISMPDAMGDWIEGRIQAGDYSNDSEYFRDLVRHDQERQDSILKLRKTLDDAAIRIISARPATRQEHRHYETD